MKRAIRQQIEEVMGERPPKRIKHPRRNQLAVDLSVAMAADANLASDPHREYRARVWDARARLLKGESRRDVTRRHGAVVVREAEEMGGQQ